MHGGFSRFSSVLLSLAVILVIARGGSAAELPGGTRGPFEAASSNSQEDGDTRVVPLAVATKPISPGGTVEMNAAGKATGSASQSAPPLALTPGKKFKYFARSSFLPPMPYALSVLSGVFSEATDNDHHRHMSSKDFLADSMTHAARSFAFRATANFFEKFAYATAFKQDPRYFRSDKKGIGRIGYAISRVFVTRSDGGDNQFNASFFAGALTTAGISNAWARKEHRTVGDTMGRFGTHVGYTALSNVIKELFGKR